MDSLYVTYTWGPPAIAVVLGLGLGAWAAASMKAVTTSPAVALRAERTEVIRRIRELDVEKSRMPQDQYEEARRGLILEAARLLRDLDGAAPGGRSHGAWGAHLAVAGVLALVLILVSSTFQSRVEAALAAQAQAVPTERRHAATEGGAELPADLGALNRVAHEALFEGDLATTMAAVEKARGISPGDLEVRVHVAALRISVGMYSKAEPDLDEVLAARPAMAEAWLWKGISRGKQGDDAGARAALEKVQSLDPQGLGEVARSILSSVPSTAP